MHSSPPLLNQTPKEEEKSFFFVSVLRSVSVERLGVSRMRDFFKCLLEILSLGLLGKNPAYGRHRISWQMLIEAPTQKKTYKDLVKRGWAAVHCTSEPWSTFLSIELHCTSFLCSALHWKVLKIYVVSMHSNSIPLTHWTSLYSKLLICSALQCIGLHCSPYSAQHCTALVNVF